MLYEPKVFASALTPAQVVAVQGRAGCRPACAAADMCGSDGCGGSCGSCSGARTCGSSPSGGPRTCQMPTTLTVPGFYDGGADYMVRFAPPYAGTWTYVTHSSTTPELDGAAGSLVADEAARAHNHGPVASNGYALQYADGTPHFSVGSTSYQWTSKGFAMQAQTLQTLAEGPDGGGPVFNKLRMTVFPKWYRNNHANPVETGTAYEIRPGSVAANATAWGCVGGDCPSTAGSFDLARFNVSYWRNYEKLVRAMQRMGVVADVIVFHPYDGGHWGFDCLGGRDPQSYDTANDDFYLRYLAARLSAFSNVWWAMANEWNFVACKSYNTTVDNGPTPVWDHLFRTLGAADVYGRQTSIHNGALLYNHSQPWISHVSVQGREDTTPDIRATYGKPLIWDEVRYEGNISSSWGALSGEEMADRFWWGAALGVHCGHSETIERFGVSDDAQPLWWAKGGTLVGHSPQRIRWFGSLWGAQAAAAAALAAGAASDGALAARPMFGTLVPSQTYFDDASHSALVADVLASPDGSYRFVHFLRSGRWTVPLGAADASRTDAWEVRALDYWGMKVAVVQTLPHDAANATIDVASIPANFEIARASGYKS